MTVYKIKRDGYKYRELDLDVNDFIDDFPEEYDYGQAHDFYKENIAMASFWKLMKTGWSPIEGHENFIPDITTWINSTLVLSPKAHRLLGDTLKPYGEFLPVMVENETDEKDERYYIFNCLTNADGKLRSESTIEGTYEVDFEDSVVGDKLIFKSRTQYCMDLFCNERFKELVESFGLNGILFD